MPLSGRPSIPGPTVHPPGEAVNLQIPMLITSALLAAAGGLLDGFTYVGHGHVFANAMTGNLVLLGINCFSGSWQRGLRHLPPILAFGVGISAAKALHLSLLKKHIRDPYLAALGLEVGVLLILSFLPSGIADFWMTTSIAFAASVQVETFRQVNGRSFNSTYMTGNLRTLSESIFDYFFAGRSPESARVAWDFTIIGISFLCGVLAGGNTVLRLGNRTLWFDIAILLLVAIRIWPRAGKIVDAGKTKPAS